MGKKSLIKSTAKKKTKSAKKDEVKKIAKKANVTAKAKTKTANKVRSKQPVAAAKKKTPSLKELILKKFEVWKPAEVFRAAIDEEYLKNFASPPIIADFNDEKAKKIKKLLLKKRDIATIRSEIKKEAAEKAAAEKAAAEKAAAEKAATEKAAAEKAAAEKAAAEKAAAEKAAAEKAAAEKAAEKKKAYLKALPFKKFAVWKPIKIFKAAIDEEYLKNFASPTIIAGFNDEKAKKIKKLLLKKRDMATIRSEIKKEAAEKAAAEKAAAEREAAEKIAAKQAAAEREAAEKATMKKVILGLVFGFIILFVFIFSSSSSNNSKYYIKESNGALEIWQGIYAPMGEERIMSLPGVPLPEQINAVYSEAEVFPLIFNYYIDKADALSGVSDAPDYLAIKSYLNKALEFATTDDLSKKANSRLNNIYTRLDNIKFNDLIYKADVAESRETIADLNEATKYLNKTSLLKVGTEKSDVVQQKIKAIKNKSAEIKAQIAEKATNTVSDKSDVVEQKITTKKQNTEIKTPIIEESTDTVSGKSDEVKQKIKAIGPVPPIPVIEKQEIKSKEQSAEIKTPIIEESTDSVSAE